MRNSLWSVLFALALTMLAAGSSLAEQAGVAQRLTSGGHILMIRHALAPGTGDPADFRIGDCTTQRNLNDKGRDQARAIGNWLRTQNVTSARVYSSQWCRCLETARLLNLGPVMELSALNSFFERTQDREANLTALRKFIADQPHEGELIIMVTHFVTIAALTGEGVASGGGVLLELGGVKAFSVVGRLDFGS